MNFKEAKLMMMEVRRVVISRGGLDNWLRRSTREPSETLEMFWCILIWVVVMWVYTYKQLRFMDFIQCIMLDLNKK